jgi:hypothetical protein
MSMPTAENAIQPVVLQGQIIVGALITGVSIFLVIATLVDLGPNPGAGAGAGVGAGAEAQAAAKPDQSVPFLTYAALAFGAVVLPMSFIVPGLVAKQQRQAIVARKPASDTDPAAKPGIAPEGTQLPASGLAAAFLVQLIIGAAMDEGAAFFAAVAYMIEKNPIAIALAVVLVAALAARFPTANRVKRWIEQQQEKLGEEQLSGLLS